MTVLLLLLVNVLAGAGSASAEPVTAVEGTASNWECRSVSLTHDNAIGYLALPLDGQTVDARILYREGRRQSSLHLRMTRSDAESLRVQIQAMLRGLRTRAIRFEAVISKGSCHIARVLS